MSNKSRRRLTLAAGALLAGAAIPIAAAGVAWADDPAQADQTETAKQLEHQGLTKAEAQAVVTAENNSTPVQVSYDDTTVVNDNQGATSADQASASSAAGPKDVATAIGDGSIAGAAGSETIGSGIDDKAYADGPNAEALSGDGSHDSASATGDSAYSVAVGGNHNTATDNGSSSATTGAIADGGSHDKAVVNGDFSLAEAGFGFNHDKAEALGSDLTADATDKNHQTVIVHPSGAESTAVTDPHVALLPLP
jgi:hypothetical protein